MYLLTSHIPIVVDRGATFVDVSWHRDVLLARDWLAARYPPLTLVAPQLPIAARPENAVPLARVGAGDGIRVLPSFDLPCRTRTFWFRPRRRWLQDIRSVIADAVVVHGSVGDPLRPIGCMALKEGQRHGATTVLVGPDIDPLLKRGRLRQHAFRWVFARAVKAADLVMLKEGAVMDRYGHWAAGIKPFCHSMTHDADVVGEDQLTRRLAESDRPRPLKAVYAGRLVRRKGLADSIRAIARARELGAKIEFHVFGTGPQEGQLRDLANQLGTTELVRFHGYVEFGPEFLRELRAFDFLLFTPTEEDTPRMLYDALAAGLPLIGTEIPFLRDRVAKDRVGVVVPVGDVTALAQELKTFDTDRDALARSSIRAREAGLRHTVEQWYGRRAEWTHAAVDRKRAAAGR